MYIPYEAWSPYKASQFSIASFTLISDIFLCDNPDILLTVSKKCFLIDQKKRHTKILHCTIWISNKKVGKILIFTYRLPLLVPGSIRKPSSVVFQVVVIIKIRKLAKIRDGSVMPRFCRHAHISQVIVRPDNEKKNLFFFTNLKRLIDSIHPFKGSKKNWWPSHAARQHFLGFF